MESMKRILVTLTVAMLMIGASAVTASAFLTITSGQYIGSGGAGTGESLAGDRFRSFKPTGGDENYLGVPSLGVAGNRVAQQLGWMGSDTLQSFAFTFQYDQANDRLVSTIFGGTIYYDNWSTLLTPKGKTKGAADLNAFQITVASRDALSSVYLTNMVLDGTALGSFNYPTVNSGFFDWLVTGSDLNLTDGFTLTGTLWLQGSFSDSQENSRVDLIAGWDSRGSAPSAPVPIPAAAWLLGSGLVGLVAIRRRMKK